MKKLKGLKVALILSLLLYLDQILSISTVSFKSVIFLTFFILVNLVPLLSLIELIYVLKIKFFNFWIIVALLNNILYFIDFSPVAWLEEFLQVRLLDAIIPHYIGLTISFLLSFIAYVYVKKIIKNEATVSPPVQSNQGLV